jgi:5-methylcytosine-specific restriction endonuclease McrA
MKCIGEEFDGRCAYCPSPATAWDHVVPVARGGETRPHNIVPACRPCNSSKRTQDVWTWLARTGRTPHERLHDRLDLEDIHGR